MCFLTLDTHCFPNTSLAKTENSSTTLFTQTTSKPLPPSSQPSESHVSPPRKWLPFPRHLSMAKKQNQPRGQSGFDSRPCRCHLRRDCRSTFLTSGLSVRTLLLAIWYWREGLWMGKLRISRRRASWRISLRMRQLLCIVSCS